MASKALIVALLASLVGISYAVTTTTDYCAGSPTQYCDFLIQGSTSVPTVSLQVFSGNRILSGKPIVYKTGEGIKTAYSYQCTFPNEKGKKARTACGSMFHFMSQTNSWNETTLVGSHMITKQNLDKFKNKCVKMLIDNVMLAKGGWVNNGDGKAMYPQRRRCVMDQNLTMASRGLCAALLLAFGLVLCLQAVPSQSARCYSRPLAPCDFMVQGSAGVVPQYRVVSFLGNRLLSRTPIIHKSGDLVLTASSDDCTFVNSGAGCENRFFFMPPGNDYNRTNYIGQHPIDRTSLAVYKQQCVLLYMNNALLARAGWLNNGDNKRKFPQARRFHRFQFDTDPAVPALPILLIRFRGYPRNFRQSSHDFEHRDDWDWSLSITLLLVSLVAALSHSDPPTNLILNGDMEEPGVRGDASIAGPLTRRHRKRLPSAWHLVSGSIKYVRLEHWPAASGDHSIALNGHGPATLAQRVVTRPGEFYFVHFDLAGDPGLEDEGAVRSLRVSVMDEESGAPVTARTYEFDTFSHGGAEEAKRSREGMGWRSHTLAFEAPGAAVTLLFASTTPGIHGPVIDNVRVHKQNATSAFLHSPNTIYHSPTIDTVGPAATPEACGRRCLEIPDCRGFSIDIPVPGLSDTSVQCHLKMLMKKPSVVGQNRADSYVLKRAECSFGHSNAMQCPDMLPISGMLPMACVAHKSAKRQTEHPFAGTCKALRRTNLCPYAGGYFAKGFGNIGSADDYRRCSCVEGSGGIARLQCGHVV
ncbi:unnamed protein product [Closterium sp. Yama58-4]|nr:unnamed protein product [Closterium sp. Yama58-4]